VCRRGITKPSSEPCAIYNLRTVSGRLVRDSVYLNDHTAE
jgi:hypothetical protein